MGGGVSNGERKDSEGGGALVTENERIPMGDVCNGEQKDSDRRGHY